jgi:hypothetical protein
MVEILRTEADSVVALKINGQFSYQDYKQVIPVINQNINDFGKANILFDIESFSGWHEDASYKEVKHDLNKIYYVEKAAIVGGKDWWSLINDYIRPIFDTHIRFFEFKDAHKAIEWIAFL